MDDTSGMQQSMTQAWIVGCSYPIEAGTNKPHGIRWEETRWYGSGSGKVWMSAGMGGNFLKDLGRKMRGETGKPKSMEYLLQCSPTLKLCSCVGNTGY